MAQTSGKVDPRIQISGHWLLTHFLMFGQQPRLPIDFLFPTHDVMGKVKPMDAYVLELIGTLRKAFEIAWAITQEEAARQK